MYILSTVCITLNFSILYILCLFRCILEEVFFSSLCFTKIYPLVSANENRPEVLK